MQSRGFTLIELLATLALIALVATVALPLAELTIQRGKEAELRTALRQIRTALDAYKQASDEGRILQKSGESGYPKNLEVLVDGIEDAKGVTRTPLRFLRRLPRDPFANPDLRPQDTWGLRSYRSSPGDPKPGEDVYDVFSRATGVGINGIPYREW